MLKQGFGTSEDSDQHFGRLQWDAESSTSPITWRSVRRSENFEFNIYGLYSFFPHRKTKTSSFFLVTRPQEKAPLHLKPKKTFQSNLLNVKWNVYSVYYTPINKWILQFCWYLAQNYIFCTLIHYKSTLVTNFCKVQF